MSDYIQVPPDGQLGANVYTVDIGMSQNITGSHARKLAQSAAHGER